MENNNNTLDVYAALVRSLMKMAAENNAFIKIQLEEMANGDPSKKAVLMDDFKRISLEQFSMMEDWARIRSANQILASNNGDDFNNGAAILDD